MFKSCKCKVSTEQFSLTKFVLDISLTAIKFLDISRSSKFSRKVGILYKSSAYLYWDVSAVDKFVLLSPTSDDLQQQTKASITLHKCCMRDFNKAWSWSSNIKSEA